jgi:alpha-mannosidase
MRQIFTKVLGVVLLLITQVNTNAQKKLYISNDDHTDYMWTANEIVYDSAIVQMIDWWIDYNEATALANSNPYYQSKWNCDGSFWVTLYEKYRSAEQFDRLIAQIKTGQITVPYSPLIVTNGAVPAEAVLRGMYYAGSLERRRSLDLDMAIGMENQTLPLGLSSLWKGAGAKYCWHGVCACFTDVPGLTSRQNQMYWYTGLDTNKVLLKWYNLQPPPLATGDTYFDNRVLGGYAEARFPTSGGVLNYDAIDSLADKCLSAKYPYNIAAAFGVGWDDLDTKNDKLVAAAQAKTIPGVQQVIVSNEVDFFKDFEANYGAGLANVTQTFGNDWDLACASIAEISGKMKRSLEKLRSAEAMAAIVINYYPTVFQQLDSARKEAWTALGLYWEHSLGFGYISNVPEMERIAFQIRLETSLSYYVDQLHNIAFTNLSNLITKDNNSTGPRFFSFNPLGWQRTDYADYLYNTDLIPLPIRVFDVTANTEVPSQFVTKNGSRYLRILAENIPSIGYKVFEIRPGTVSPAFPETGTIISSNEVDCDSFRIKYNNTGVITSIIDHRHGDREMVQNGKFLNDLGAGNSTTGITTVESNGPVSITIRTVTTVPLADTTRITLFKKMGRIEVDNKIIQNFDVTKTWSYAFNIGTPEIWHEETGAVIKAKLTTNNSNPGHYAPQNAKYDWLTLNHFASVNETDNSYGISLSNEDCYFMKIGASAIGFLDETSAEINVLAGGRNDMLGIPNQGGSTTFNQRFAITTHTAYNAADEMKKALEHQNSLVCGEVYNPVNFLLPNQYSYLSSNDPGSVIWAVKPAEEGYDRGTVIRVWNFNNTDAASTLTSNLKISNAYRTTHVETDMSDITGTIINNSHDLPVPLGHNEMKTFRIKLIVIALPVKSLSFSGDKIQSSNILKWDNKGEDLLQKYELERSTNGQQFSKINTIIAKAGVTNNYTYTDNDINLATPYYYRLKMINTNGSFSYSSTILIRAAKEASNIIIFPNPVVDVLKANFVLDQQTRCNVVVINSAGAIVKTAAPPLFERGNNYYMLPVKELPAGEYIFSVTAGDKKFVKVFIKK